MTTLRIVATREQAAAERAQNLERVVATVDTVRDVVVGRSFGAVEFAAGMPEGTRERLWPVVEPSLLAASGRP